jgi:transcriptional regulator with XRE-family HTH domain
LQKIKLCINMRIKEVLRERNITAKELADKMGISAASLSVAINGNTTVGTLQRIATALNVPITELFEQKNVNQTICPHCGKEIKIEIK